jgi:YD repeat-containing protein
VQFHYMSRRYSYDHAGRVSSVGQLQNYSIMPPFNGTYGYDAFDNLTSRSGNYAINPTQSDSASYTYHRRAGWTYNAEGQVLNSSDNSDSGGSSTRAWTYDAAGQLTFTSEVRNGQTTTLATGYDGDGRVSHEIINSSTGDYLIQSSVLGTVLTKLKVNGGKDTTYVPANELVYPMQMQDQPYSSPASYLKTVVRDPLGIQEDHFYAIDPFGNSVANVQPPSGGPPGYTPTYGPPYGWVSNSFTNGNNFSNGCALDGRPADCNTVRFKLQNSPFVQLDPTHSLPWTESGANQTPQLPVGVREEWRLVQPGQRAPEGAKTRSDHSGEFIFYADYSFFGGENFFPDPQEPITGFHPDACGAMAEQAQRIANTAVKNAGGDFRRALVEFDFNLGTLYAGRPLRGWEDAAELQKGADTSKAFGLLGESGFQQEFQEGRVSNDQTHHFVTYFSGGLNAQDGILKIHRATEDQPADRRLGDRAQQFGHVVRNDPQRLQWIGNSIQIRICDNRERPVLR